MPKVFYTERDIEDLVKQGVMSLEVGDDAVLTDLAYEKAGQLGMKLLRMLEKPPSAPVRPYVATMVQKSPGIAENISSASDSDLNKRVHDAVIARLGNEIDHKLLDVIIQRVLNNVGR
ncbi:MAG: hypothetical protein MUO76_01100 [Anaerolineaceae bacterium]|nr:hypothetical protein [Anaerolineaceae bacterium]